MVQDQENIELDSLISSLGNQFMYAEWDRLDKILDNVTYSDDPPMESDQQTN